MTGDRVEAAAKAIRRAKLGEQYPRLATTVRWQDTADAEAALAAADECDRVAGVVRLDTNAASAISAIANVFIDAMHFGDWAQAESYARDALFRLAALATAGAPEETP